MFQRFEFKYMIDLETKAKVLHALAAFTRFDKHSQGGGYPISSLYYDTPSFANYFEKLEGEKERSKFRIRKYPGTNAPIFLEEKRRSNTRIQKHRLPVSPKQALQFEQAGNFIETGFTDLKVNDKKTAERLFFLKKRFQLKPAVITRYFRLAIEAKFEKRLRITFDTDLRTCAAGGETLPAFLKEGRKYPKRFLSHDTCIMEIKGDSWMPLWITSIVQHFNLEQSSYSKYCEALEISGHSGALIKGVF